MQILMLHLTKTNNAQRLPKEKVFWNWLRTLNNRLDCVPTLQIKLDGKLSLTLAIFRSGEFQRKQATLWGSAQPKGQKHCQTMP